MIGINTIVNTAVHLEVVLTTDCSNINMKMIVVVVMMQWVVEEHGLKEDNMRREMIVTPVVTIHHPHQVKMIVALDQEVESNYAVGITGDGTRKRMMPIRKKKRCHTEKLLKSRRRMWQIEFKFLLRERYSHQKVVFVNYFLRC